ncbi:3-oxoacyl-ACP synthase III family protein [Nocardia sp. BMG51109]|uniref:3-oxoacyl-ACP synthase III family protein n=1 Tax=Nocardia sp. BMG51109 TaxID=1056816 RepID=UPI0004665F61|nr:ketoacyl-ACP synthase III [Nocardia sp. BMG51109]
MAVGIVAMSGYVPSREIAATDIAEWTGADAQRIIERTGVGLRRYAAPGQATSDLAVRAVRGLPDFDPATIRYLIVATSTPDQPQPSTAAIVQGKLGLEGVPAFDVNAVCTGFLYALVIGSRLLDAGDDDGMVLMVGADRYSGIVDRTDWRTCALFGDGAGAVLLGQVPDGFGIRGHTLTAHGSHRDLVGVAAGGSARPTTGDELAAGADRFRMQGRPVKEYALDALPEVVDSALALSGLEVGDVHRAFLHQGNVRLVEACADVLKLSRDRVPITADRFGNTAAASIPLTMVADRDDTAFARGEHYLLAGIGGGMTAGAVVATWY